MRISEIFSLNKTQAELDFIDIDIEHDTALFIDPFFLGLRQDNWSTECTRTIQSFFQRSITLLKQRNINEARALFDHLHEPNSTCLGLSKGKPRGRGVGRGNTNDIFESFAGSKAIQTGLVQDLEDNVLFVEGFGKDKLSDMTTNIIRAHLIQYTVDQCELHGITLRENVPSGFYWNRRTNRWEQEMTRMLVISGRVILLVPKGIASFCEDYTPKNYYEQFILNFMQNEHLRMNSTLVQTRKGGIKYVTKRDLKERHPFSKEFVTDFTQRHPEILRDFKKRTRTSSLTNEEIASHTLNDEVAYFNFGRLISFLVEKLKNIRSGNEHATEYHRTITGILEMIFYPSLIYPTLEQEIHQGRKRIDLTFDNAAETGIFYRLHTAMGLPCQYVYVECKNYSSDPANPELDQLAGRFSPNRGRIGFLVCRSFDNFGLFMQRCRDTYSDDRGLIVPIQDSDLISMLENYSNWNDDFVERFLSDRIREIVLN